MLIKSASSIETEELGKKIAGLLKSGDVIALDGDLGAGKTCLTRGIAAGVGSTSHVSSPTFTIVNEYTGGSLDIFHFDTYRLSGEDDFLASGLDEYFYREGASVIEWSEIIGGLLPEGTIHIQITGSGDVREINIDCPGDRMKEIEAALC